MFFFSVPKKALNGNESLFNLQFQGMASGKSLGKPWWGRTRMVSDLLLFFRRLQYGATCVYSIHARERLRGDERFFSDCNQRVTFLLFFQ